MVKVHVKFDEGVPQYTCSSCSQCSSIFGRSLCSIKDRGCCWYFPKFTLYDIHRMSKSDDGLKVLKNFTKLFDVRIYNYYIHAKGYFDSEGYSKFLQSEESQRADVLDKSIFFRACPFIKPGVGCSIPVKYRSYICNFFICGEVINEIERNSMFKAYIDERDSYVRWLEWENSSLENILREHKLTLVSNFTDAVELLKKIPLNNYEFPMLPSIEETDKFYMGA